MKSENLFSALSEADESYVRSAAALLGYEEEAMNNKNRKPGRILRTVLLVAAIVAALGATAYAAGVFTQHLDQPAEGETVKVHYSVLSPDGTVLEGGDREARNIGLVISYEGQAESQVEFSPGWLPEGPTTVTRGRDAASGYYDFMDSYDPSEPAPNTLGIPYQISTHYADPGFKYIVQGRVDIVKEETWGELEVTEFVQTQDLVSTGRTLVTNFVLVFSPEEGWMISVGGALDLETLEHIARELDVRSTGEAPWQPNLEDMDFSALGVARG